MRVAVIGGAGKMGAWFAQYFLRQGHEVIISDIRVDRAEAVAKSLGAKVSKNNVEAAKMADISLISTPIDVTPKVLMEIFHEAACSTIIEISSLKSKVWPVLRKIAEKRIRVLSIHPLFGPGLQEIIGGKIALIPVYDQQNEENTAKKLFPTAEIIVVDHETHDRVMAVTLALTHFINIVFAAIIGGDDVTLLKQLGGTTFTLQLALSEGIMTENPMLYATIQIDNKHALSYLEKFMSKANALKELIRKSDFDGFIEFYEETRNLISKDKDFSKAYEKIYRALKSLQID